MRHTEDGWVYSPSDLLVFMESPYASAMERRRAAGILGANEKRDAADPLMEQLSKRGQAHEDALTAAYRDAHEHLVELAGPGSGACKLSDVERLAKTVGAMDRGAPVIAQAFLRKGQFAGYADYLHRVETPCERWAWSYEAWDAKLTRSVKPSHLVQLCAYSAMLEEMQGGMPAEMVVVTGDRQEHRFRVAEFAAFQRALEAQFLAAHEDDQAAAPDPAESGLHGRWSDCAARELSERDHLSQVANIRRSQIARLEAAGVDTMAALAELVDDHRVEGLNPDIRRRLTRQASLQLESDTPPPLHQVITPDPDGPARGLDALPPHSLGDIFFDIEGHPGEEGGLEYLWGATYYDADGEVVFRDFWGHDPDGEAQAFTDFMDWAHARWEEHPGMHIYHYAAYEITALRKLMGRTGLREREVDDMLRGNRFVDLYNVVRNGVVVGEPRYSIKNMEALYWPGRGREEDVKDGSQSIEVYEHWRENPDGDTADDSELLASLREYNKVDCDSTLELTRWLRDRQAEAGIEWRDPDAGNDQELTAAEEEKAETRSEADQARRDLADLLEARGDCAKTGTSGDTFTLLGQLLHYHQREDKPTWWRYFDRLSQDDDMLWADYECLVDVRRTDRPPFRPGRTRKDRVEYAYDTSQPYKGTVGTFKPVHDPDVTLDVQDCGDDTPGRLVFIDDDRLEDRMTLVPFGTVRNDGLRAAVMDVAERVGEVDESTKAICDLLERRPPDTAVPVETVARCADDPAALLATLSDAVQGMRASTLCIQGPPGAGKTYTASHLISDLLASGHRVGVTANSHKASDNLLRGVQCVMAERGEDARIVKVQSGVMAADIPLCADGAELVSSASKLDIGEDSVLVGGTAWCFSHDRCQDAFDYLFIDEAGQYSLANTVAVSRAAKNLVMLGDQMQLAQPVQGTHPGESGRSALDYYLDGARVIPNERGVFLPRSWRMHPDICEVISEQIYEGRLGHAPVAESHRLCGGDDGAVPQRTGIVWHPVAHAGNEQDSQEEADAIAALVASLLTRSFGDAEPRRLTLDDILVVTPYNAQRERLQRRLPDGARVGTVDLFQGQEAPVVILSLAASNADLAPRGLDFLFDINRLNVAISRAQALAIVVGSNELVASTPRNIDQLRKLNLFCRLREGSGVGSD
ncbi:MAG: TM0106 family RecB-like putative nuclease [Litorimonas sp.]